jgi:hypothetical protein
VHSIRRARRKSLQIVPYGDYVGQALIGILRVLKNNIDIDISYDTTLFEDIEKCLSFKRKVFEPRVEENS